MHVQLHVAGREAVDVEEIIDELGLQSRITLDHRQGARCRSRRFPARHEVEPTQNHVHRRAELVAHGCHELVLHQALALGLFLGFALSGQQPLAFPLGPSLGAHVSTDADQSPGFAVAVARHTSAFGDPHDAAVRPNGPVLAFIAPRLQRALDRGFHPAPVFRMDRADDTPIRSERAFWKSKQLLRVARPAHRSGPQVPFPGADLSDLDRHSKTLLILLDAAKGDGQRHRPFLDAALQFMVRNLEGRLGLHALRDLRLQHLIQSRELPGLPKQVHEHRDFRPEDLRIDRLAQVVHRTGPVAEKDILLLDRVRRQKQNGDVLCPLPLLDQSGQLDAIHPRHLDVEDHRREFVPQQREQRFVGRLGANQRASARLEHGLERVEVAPIVVDEEDLDVRVTVHARVHPVAHRRSSVQPHPQERQQLVCVHGLGDVVRRPGLETFLTIAFHGLRRQGQNGQPAERRMAADFTYCLVTVHLGHHDVYQYQAKVRCLLDQLDRLPAVGRAQHVHLLILERGRERKDVPCVVIDHEHLALPQDIVRAVEPFQELSLWLRQLGDDPVEE